jgi:hypothetical protein
MSSRRLNRPKRQNTSFFAAKRLSVRLSIVVADYERKFGKLEIGVERPAGTPVQ